MEEERVSKVDERYWMPMVGSNGEPLNCRVPEYLALLEEGYKPTEALNKMKVFSAMTRAAFMQPIRIIPNYRRIGDGYKDATSRLKLKRRREKQGEVIPLVDVPKSVSVPTKNPDPNYVSPEGFPKAESIGITLLCSP